MKKILLISILVAACQPKPTEFDGIKRWSAVELLQTQHRELSDWDKLIMAICWTESRFDPSALGKNQDAGIMQITPIYVEEVNRVSGTNFKHEDAYSIELSLEMFSLMNAAKNPSRDLDRAIYFHNKGSVYKQTVLANLEMIERYETLRAKLTEK